MPGSNSLASSIRARATGCASWQAARARPGRSIEALPHAAGKTMAIVTTPHALHADHVAFALRAQLACALRQAVRDGTSEARTFAAEADRRKLVNAVAFNRRFDRGCLRAREIIRAGGIGTVRYVETVQLGYEGKGWFLVPALGGGGPFTGRATHMADIVPWLSSSADAGAGPRARRQRERVDRGGFIELMFGDLECHMTCIEEGWHMWDEVRIFGDDGLIELRRPLKLPIGWELTVRTRRGEALEGLDGRPYAWRRHGEFSRCVAHGCSRRMLIRRRRRRRPQLSSRRSHRPAPAAAGSTWAERSAERRCWRGGRFGLELIGALPAKTPKVVVYDRKLRPPLCEEGARGFESPHGVDAFSAAIMLGDRRRRSVTVSLTKRKAPLVALLFRFDRPGRQWVDGSWVRGQWGTWSTWSSVATDRC